MRKVESNRWETWLIMSIALLFLIISLPLLSAFYLMPALSFFLLSITLFITCYKFDPQWFDWDIQEEKKIKVNDPNFPVDHPINKPLKAVNKMTPVKMRDPERYIKFVPLCRKRTFKEKVIYYFEKARDWFN